MVYYNPLYNLLNTHPYRGGLFSHFFPKIYFSFFQQFSYKVFFTHTLHSWDYPPFLTLWQGRGAGGIPPSQVVPPHTPQAARYNNLIMNHLSGSLPWWLEVINKLWTWRTDNRKLLTMGESYQQTICHVNNFMNISLVYTWGFCIFV